MAGIAVGPDAAAVLFDDAAADRQSQAGAALLAGVGGVDLGEAPEDRLRSAMRPSGFEALLGRRRRSGLDRLDEVWEGVRHMVPAPSGQHAEITQQLAVILDAPARAAGLVPAMGEFNLGESEHDFRVPDGGVHRARPRGVWFPTAALVVQIISPGDESWEKLPFYARHAVDEVLIVDPQEHAVHWLVLTDDEYRPTQRSGLVDLGPAELVDRIDWPAAG